MLFSNVRDINDGAGRSKFPIIMRGLRTGYVFMFISENTGVCLHAPERYYKVGLLVKGLISVYDRNWVKFDGVIELSNNKILHGS